MRKVLYMALTAMLCACSAPEVQHVYGRYVPERKDDFAWENEFAAYRMYGPELAKFENPSNGIDIFMKNTPAFVIDTFFYYYVNEERPYHVQHGYGFDGYKVAHTPGMGGVAAVVDSAVYVGGHYDQWQILEQNNDMIRFQLHYDSLNIAGDILQEDIIITCESGKVLNRAQVVVYGESDKAIRLGTGLWLHDSIGTLCGQKGLLLYTENAMSDPGAVRLNKKWYDCDYLGETHEAVYMPSAGEYTLYDNNIAVLSQPYTLGDTITYYFGGCWSGWTDGEKAFPKHDDWKAYIQNEIQKL
ncbi:MAG: DUF4861 domain-containing protein [Paludibacteraceae bacterium]|nr:DUF4861 domain-containing protein [Paludibacteraceae bacterium]